jgi:hypothetical protein
MVDLVRKEEISTIKAKVLGILNMVISDDLYNKEMMVVDLTNLVAALDEMDDKIERIDTKSPK